MPNITPGSLTEAISDVLTVYSQEVTDRVNQAGAAAMKELVTKTKATAPKGARGDYRKHITSTTQKGKRGDRYIWHVKAPDHRLTHLLVHGHATKDGGRTKADPFLQNALNEVLPGFEHEIEEAVKP